MTFIKKINEKLINSYMYYPIIQIHAGMNWNKKYKRKAVIKQKYLKKS